MKQKTIRFYGKSKEDMAAYETLKKYREYGFNNEREFIIAAVNRYKQRDKEPAEELDINQLATLIAEKLRDSDDYPFNTKSKTTISQGNSESEILDKALYFIENL